MDCTRARLPPSLPAAAPCLGSDAGDAPLHRDLLLLQAPLLFVLTRGLTQSTVLNSRNSSVFGETVVYSPAEWGKDNLYSLEWGLPKSKF